MVDVVCAAVFIFIVADDVVVITSYSTYRFLLVVVVVDLFVVFFRTVLVIVVGFPFYVIDLAVSDIVDVVLINLVVVFLMYFWSLLRPGSLEITGCILAVHSSFISGFTPGLLKFIARGSHGDFEVLTHSSASTQMTANAIFF